VGWLILLVIVVLLDVSIVPFNLVIGSLAGAPRNPRFSLTRSRRPAVIPRPRLGSRNENSRLQRHAGADQDYEGTHRRFFICYILVGFYEVCPLTAPLRASSWKLGTLNPANRVPERALREAAW
jgi:hypothetical protein